MADRRFISHEEPGDEPPKMQSQAVAEYYPEHYAATGGRASPRLPHEMTEEGRLATAIARFRPLNQPLPPGFDLESLPMYRTPVSLPTFEEFHAANALMSMAASTQHVVALSLAAQSLFPAPGALPFALEQPTSAAADPQAAQPAPQPLSCQWEGCRRNFSGDDAPASLVTHINNEHVGAAGSANATSRCRWRHCVYNHPVRRFLVSHCMTHVPQYKIFFCSTCGRGFQQKAHLVSHERTHAK
ncbi:hypothetical protein QM012_005540 [Aureobasidium pullulans]|uniref:C2H2-type domain-containing protein n=1 Tax=Aureobasidium pullulans TaxID=5580 RepID=A0ABR0T4Q7_AURPU